jgi:hypothetical protein
MELGVRTHNTGVVSGELTGGWEAGAPSNEVVEFVNYPEESETKVD